MGGAAEKATVNMDLGLNNYSTSMDGGASIYGGGRFKVRIKSMRLSTLIKEVTSIGLNLASLGLGLKMDCKDANICYPRKVRSSRVSIKRFEFVDGKGVRKRKPWITRVSCD